MEVETTAGRVRIHHTRLPDHYLEKEVRETEKTLLLFARILGDTSGDRMVRHVYSPREWGQGFARTGMIVLSEGRVLRTLAKDPDTSFVHGNAHEAAHFWWRFGSGQGDWINESFAEYFAMLAVRAGQRVTERQPLGRVGNSGNSSEPHLHLHAVRGRATDPQLLV